eukprot:CAMPEP_0115637500 /NCGR_PEP_ID=MMETSP0272-20121206/34226_1 /TAXON_ID=71861 /ORGANISM="Scrippsiella trochoidea, Strain CCMP3099" /LENGTH=260 /DNA_ID=CAMNT_0003074557 /DNA_START=55 /DNA_END=834 /DNA_ORIENTATION=-
MSDSSSSDDGEGDSMFWLHWICFAAWVAMSFVIWAGQNVLRRGIRRGIFETLAPRITKRLKLSESLQEFQTAAKPAVFLFLAGSVILATFGLASSFMVAAPPESLSVTVKSLFVLFVTPALVEEIFFRGLLLPLPTEEHLPVDTDAGTGSELGWCGGSVTDPSTDQENNQETSHGTSTASALNVYNIRWFDHVVALVAFTTYHLDIIHTPSVFRDLRFIVMALILGLFCQMALIRTESLWPGIFMHWFWVWGWLTFGSPP